jgi:hypothetical protein
VVLVLRAVAWQVKGREARSVLGELMGPERVVRLVLRNPIFVHVLEQIELSKAFKESADIGAGIGWDLGAIGKAISGVWGGNRVILTSVGGFVSLQSFKALELRRIRNIDTTEWVSNALQIAVLGV